MNGVPEIRTDVLVRFPENDRKHRDLGDVAEAGELLQRRLGLDRQAGQLPDHEVRHIVGVMAYADDLLADAIYNVERELEPVRGDSPQPGLSLVCRLGLDSAVPRPLNLFQ